MELTQQQKSIVESSGNLKVQAVAGSGKTSTLIEYAKTRARAKRILYLAFNRSVRLHAQQTFKSRGCPNVEVETAHSLAYRHVVGKYQYQVRSDYKPHEIMTLLGPKYHLNDHTQTMILGNHIARFCTYFCNSSAKKVPELSYENALNDPAAVKFAAKHLNRIVDGTRQMLAKMDKGEIAVPHAFYLKKFQISAPELGFDYILFDEGQDASPAMLDIFMKQNATKIIVGDIHQQIYSWRYAINALQQIDFPTLMLTTSFRFGQSVADVAMRCLAWKKSLGPTESIAITGVGNSKKAALKATLARTNLSLLRSAISFTERRARKVYFEGNFSSYTYAGEGASMWDVFSLYNNKHEMIRDPLLQSMDSFDTLREYAELTDDTELQTIIEMVEEHGKDLPRAIKRLKELHLDDDHRDDAQMVFSTVHRCKGLEYDSVTLEDDFIQESKLKKLSSRESTLTPQEIIRYNEEINLVYVALTRTKNKLSYPSEMFASQLSSETAHVPSKSFPKGEKNKFSSQRASNSRYHSGWSRADDQKLIALFRSGKDGRQICSQLKKSAASVRHRLKQLNLL